MVVRNQPCSVDLTHVKPGGRASLHSHQVRIELFHFIDDGAFLEVDGKVYQPKAHGAGQYIRHNHCIMARYLEPCNCLPVLLQRL